MIISIYFRCIEPFAVFIILVKIFTRDSFSANTDLNLSSSIKDVSFNNSSQYPVSEDSFKAIDIFEIKSALLCP